MGIYAYVDNLVIARTRYGITVCGRGGGVRGVMGSPACAAGGAVRFKNTGANETTESAEC